MNVTQPKCSWFFTVVGILWTNIVRVHLNCRSSLVKLVILDQYVTPRYQRFTHANIHFLIINGQLEMKV